MTKLAAASLLPLIALTLALALLAAQGPSPALAANFTVNSTADLTDANPGDGNCAAAGGACTLRAAIQETNSTGNTADTITLPAGTYTMTIAGGGDNAAVSGDLDVTSDLTINGAGAQTTIIDADGIDRIFHIPERDDLTINNITIRNGNTGARGGAIFNQFRGDLTINDSVLEDNTSGQYGGAISSIEAQVIINDTTIRNNTSVEGGGGIESDTGAVVVDGSAVTGNMTTGGAADGGGIGMRFAGSLTVTDSAFSNNHAGNSGGGITGGGQNIISDTLFDNNTAFRGGAFYLLFGNTAGVVLTDVQMTNNRAATDGGAVYIDGGPLTIERGTLSGNSAGLGLPQGGPAPAGGSLNGSGGAIYVEKEQSDTHIDNSTLDNNFAPTGGGAIYNEGALTITNVTISENISNPTFPGALPSGQSSGKGGGLLNAGGFADIVNATIADNVAQAGAGIQKDGGQVTITNTILADNFLFGAVPNAQPSAFFGSDCGTSPITSTGNNVVGANDCGLTPGNGDMVGTLEFPIDPMVADLAENGGPTQTQALMEGSPAIDTGNAAVCPPTDQRGFSRSANCDIGAYEFEGSEGDPKLFGDVDCDGDNDSVDALKQLQDIAGIPYQQTQVCPPIGEPVTINGVQSIWGDNDCDGDADSVDALKQLQNIAGIPFGQEPQCPEIGDPVVVSVG